MPIFDGINLIITLDSGVIEIDTEVDLYNAWKDWQLESSINRRYPKAFRTFGGDSLTSSVDAGAYFIFQNNLGWRIKPPEEDITILLTGNLAPENPLLPILIPTIGNFTVLIQGLQPITQNVDAIIEAQTNHVLNLQQYIESLRASHQAYGSTFYWDSINGDDNNDGLTANTAKFTFDAAQSLTTPFKGDVIFMLNGNPSGSTIITDPIKITVARLYLRGPGRALQFQVNNDTVPAVWLNAEGCSIEGFAIQNLSLVQPGVLLDTHNNLLRNIVVSRCGQDGIEITNNEVGGDPIRTLTILENVESLNSGRDALHLHDNIGLTLIRDGCHFEESGRDGIRLEDDCDDVHIINAIMHENSGYGINITDNTVGNTAIINPSFVNNILGTINDNGVDTVVIDDDTANITEIALKVSEIYRLRGLELGTPAINKPDSIVAGDINLTLTGDGETITTVSRNA